MVQSQLLVATDSTAVVVVVHANDGRKTRNKERERLAGKGAVTPSKSRL